MLAVLEAQKAGYEEAILLTDEGYVADGSGENIFVVKNGEIFTPDLSASILPGITRDSVIQIAQDLGHRVTEKTLIRSDLYLADEIFMCGTAAEVTPVSSVDDREVGAPGPGHEGDPDRVPRHGQGQERALVALARVRRGAGRRSLGRWQSSRACRLSPSGSRRRGSESGRRSSSSRCSARGGSRSGRWWIGSRRRSRSASVRRGSPPCRAGQPGSTSACASPASGRGTRS